MNVSNKLERFTALSQNGLAATNTPIIVSIRKIQRIWGVEYGPRSLVMSLFFV